MRASSGRSGFATRALKLRRLAQAVLLVLATLPLIPLAERSSEFPELHGGEIPPEDVVAEFDFDVPRPKSLVEADRRRARDEVPPYLRKNPAVITRVLARLDRVSERLDAITSTQPADTLRMLAELRQLGLNLSERVERTLLVSKRRRAMLRAAREFIEEVLRSGLADAEATKQIQGSMRQILVEGQSYKQVSLRESVQTFETVSRYGQEFARSRFENDRVAGEIFRELASNFLEPNIAFDAAETDRNRETAAASVPEVERRILKGEMIVEAHRRVSEDATRAYDAYREELRIRRQGELGWRVALARAGRSLISAAILAFAILYLRLHRPRVFGSERKLILLTVTTLMVLVTSSVALNAFRQLNQPWLLIPVAAGSIVVSLLIDAQLGVFFSLVVVVLVALNAGLELDFVSTALLAGFTGVYSVRRVRHRSDIFRAWLLVSVAYMFSVSAVGVMKPELDFSIVTNAGWGVLNAAISTALAFFMIPVLEVTCGVTTDWTVLELSDLNRPLLKRLMLEAPGTYHHSMVMGTLADAACDAVGANSLLCRVQCYYHDIGKINKPEYFIENIALNPRGTNPHDRLTPSMSCLILESHIRDGVELSRQHKLPDILIDAIREHHGTSEMSYFYEKAKKEGLSVDREDFRYPGPRPQTKETAIVMLADAVEASSRVLTDPHPSRLRGLVRKVIDARVADGELEECGLTLADLAKVREAFVLVLTGMFHTRIRYPKGADASVPSTEESDVPVHDTFAARRAAGGGPPRAGSSV